MLNIGKLIAVLTSMEYLYSMKEIGSTYRGIHIDSDPYFPQQSKSTKNSSRLKGKSSQRAKAVIGYAISLTGCEETSYIDGAAVLKQSIHQNSIHNPKSTSKYSYKLYAIVHPSAVLCAQALHDLLGFEVLVRDTPFDMNDIRGEFYKSRVNQSGCCGEREFIKLYAYTLVEHPIVVHLDMDVLILNPMDELFDAMLDPRSDKHRRSVPSMHNQTLPSNIQAYFTRDYNMAYPGKEHVGAQGGFLIFKPNATVLNEYVDIVLEGKFCPGSGWGCEGWGNFWGAPQIQGIVPYYYDKFYPNTAVELDRCFYNNMADPPRQLTNKQDHTVGKCMDGRDECQDCRTTDIHKVKTVHFTICQKPWRCVDYGHICTHMHRAWFTYRNQLEQDHTTTVLVTPNNGTFMPDTFLGYCWKQDNQGYIPMKFPSTNNTLL